MPVENQHLDYTHWLKTWQKCRDAYEGEDTIKRRGPVYLPQLSGQDVGEYEAYKMRATFYSATERTVKGLAGAVMRKAPVAIFPDAGDELLDSIGATGESMDALSKRVLEEVMVTGRVGLYLDAADADNANPYICIYIPENIINWRVERFGPQNLLTLVVLKEKYEFVNEDDPFVTTAADRYRVLKLDTSGETPEFSVEIWDEEKQTDKNGKELISFTLTETITPKMRGGRSLEFIPFVFASATTTTADIQKPPLVDLINVNLSHYRSQADLEHGLHFTALPTAWVAGFKVEGSNFKLGSATAWVTENPDAKAGFLEFRGTGLKSISDSLAVKKQEMAVLGGRLLEDQKNAAETATAVALRHSGERSILANIALSVSEALTDVLEWVALWMGWDATNLPNGEEATGISYTLNQDFVDTPLDSGTMQALMLALQSGYISWDVWYYQLNKGDIYPDNWDEDTEREKIAMGGPVQPPQPNADGATGNEPPSKLAGGGSKPDPNAGEIVEAA